MERPLEPWREGLGRFNNLDTVKNTTAARLFSSGATGLAKAVTITHYNFIAQHQSTLEVNPRPYRVRCILHFI